MAHEQKMIVRSRTLTNSAAEFVETGAGQAIIAQAMECDEKNQFNLPEFVTELDKFVPPDEIKADAEYFESSSAEMIRFQETLKAFCKMLRKRKLDSKLGIKIKEPNDYTMQDVMLIADLIHSQRENSDSAGYMRIIRKCFQAAREHEGTLNNLLSLAPTDIYGSVICGGFTLILAAVKDHETLRNDIQTGLADIPKKLDALHRLRNVHVKTGRLKSRADSVIVAIFVVLERIVDKLSMNFRENLFSKFKGHGGDIKRALESLDTAIAAFQEEIEFCTQMRMGRIEENGVKHGVEVSGLRVEVSAMSYGQAELKKSVEKIAENQQKLIDGQDQTMEERMTAIFYNKFYQFIASNPNFSAIDGTVSERYHQARSSPLQLRFSDPQAVIGRPGGAVIFSADKNKELVETWLADVVGSNFNPSAHIAECLNTAEKLSLEEKDKVQWIMNSDEVYEWPSKSRGCILALDARTAPSDLENPISFATAMLAACLTSTTNFPVLSFFCGIETNVSTSEANSGPLAMLNSLNGQLLKFIIEHRQTIDLTPLGCETYFQRSSQKIKHALVLFRSLLDLLGEEQDTVFILLDSLSRISGNGEDGDKIIERIIGMIDAIPGVTIKVLITDMLPSCLLRDKADFLLYLPDEVDGGKLGINFEFIQQGNHSIIQEYQAQQNKASSSSDDESSNSDW